MKLNFEVGIKFKGNAIKNLVKYCNALETEQEKQVLRARGRYEKAHRDTESLDKVHEKKMTEWKLETNREECIELDEHGSRIHANGDRK